MIFFIKKEHHKFRPYQKNKYTGYIADKHILNIRHSEIIVDAAPPPPASPMILSVVCFFLFKCLIHNTDSI